MRRAPLVLIPFIVFVTMIPAPICAQDWSQPWADPEDRPPRADFTASGGFLMPTRWSDLVLFGSASAASGALEQVLSRDVHVEPDTEFTGTATFWRGNYGFRARVGFSRSSLSVSGIPMTTTVDTITSKTTSVGIDTWLYDVGASIGFIDYTPKRTVWPYGFIGLGGITYHLKETIAPPLVFIDHPPSRPDTGGTTVIVVSDDRQFLLTTNALSTETVFAFNFGVGADFRIPLGRSGIGLRLEVSDHVAPSPLALRVEELSTFGPFSSDTGARFRLVHHLGATAGVVVQVGR
jgi:hypothetical protein